MRFRCPDCKTVLRVSDEKASRKLRCPSCSAILVIPGVPVAAAPPVAELVEQEGAAPAVGQLIEDEPVAAPVVAPRVCPSCQGRLAAAAVICVRCGYNVKTGKKMKTTKAKARAARIGGGGGFFAETIESLKLTIEGIGVKKIVWTGIFIAVAIAAVVYVYTRGRQGPAPPEGAEYFLMAGDYEKDPAGMWQAKFMQSVQWRAYFEYRAEKDGPGPHVRFFVQNYYRPQTYQITYHLRALRIDANERSTSPDDLLHTVDKVSTTCHEEKRGYVVNQLIGDLGNHVMTAHMAKDPGIKAALVKALVDDDRREGETDKLTDMEAADVRALIRIVGKCAPDAKDALDVIDEWRQQAAKGIEGAKEDIKKSAGQRAADGQSMATKLEDRIKNCQAIIDAVAQARAEITGQPLPQQGVGPTDMPVP